MCFTAFFAEKQIEEDRKQDKTANLAELKSKRTEGNLRYLMWDAILQSLTQLCENWRTALPFSSFGFCQPTRRVLLAVGLLLCY